MFPKKLEQKESIDTSGLMFPKKTKKKRKKSRPSGSILQEKDGRCLLCIMLDDNFFIWPQVHEHHVFNGPDRENCDKEGLTVYLCINHHVDGPAAVHNNREHDLILKKYAQEIWEQNHTREEFQKKFRMNYL